MSDVYQAPDNGGDGGDEGFGRFVTEAGLGGGVGGVMSAIPCFNVLNCCCCSLNVGGAALGVYLWLKNHEGQSMSTADAAVMGAISGALAGLIVGVLNLLQSLIFAGAGLGGSDQLRQILDDPNIPRETREILSDPAITQLLDNLGGSPLLSVAMIPTNMAIYGGFGVLGAMLTLHLLFGDRVRR